MAEKRNKIGADERSGKEVKALPLMMRDIVSEEEDEGGAVRISEHVIAAIVKKYALEVPGVVRFASNTPLAGLAEMIGRRSADSNIVVDLENDAVNISVTLVLEFDVRIPDVAAMVQDVVRSNVEQITGKHVSKVNIIVQDLEEIDSSDAGESE